MPKSPQSVPAFLSAFEHDHRDAILLIRDLILGADPTIGEEIKWNAPSFQTTEHFATFHLRAKTGVQVVLHCGAKPRPEIEARQQVSDPAALLDWRAVDRAIVTFRDRSDVEVKQEAFTALIREWIELL